jgi:hypothetical protein
MKPTIRSNFSNLFLERNWNSTCFGQFLCPSSGVFHCTHSNGICHTGLLTAWEQNLSRSCSQAVSKPVWHIPLLCVQWKTLDDGKNNYPKHAEFHSKNKFEKLVHLVGFIIRIYHDARPPERQKLNKTMCQISQSWKQYDSYSLGPFTVHSCLCVYQTHQSWGRALKCQLTYKTLFF